MSNTEQAIENSTIIFTAYAVANEFDLNKMAEDFGFKRKYKWEEPLILRDKTLEKALEIEVKKEQRIMLFAFGVIVYINIPSECEKRFITYLQKYESEINMSKWDKYKEKYELHINQNEEMELGDKYVSIPQFDLFYPELISMVIAKSVALEKTEEQLEKILDDIENMVDRLEKGSLNISNKKLANSISKILRHEYNSIAYIMILDKPEITWNNTEANDFYIRLSNFYELNARYKTIKEKTEILNDIIDGFTTISHSSRSFIIEWIVVLLIVLEVIIMSIELFK